MPPSILVRLTNADLTRLKNSAKVAQKLENKWAEKLEAEIRQAAKKASKDPGGSMHTPDFEDLMIEHYFEVQRAALVLAENERELESKKRLAKQPKTLQELMQQYDLWRKKKFKPSAAVKQAKDLKKAYVDAVQKSWKKWSEPFRSGEVYTQAEVSTKIQQEIQVTEARANTIVRTETTRYYNDARRAYYDRSDDVTHYIFMAVRDKATTPWCTAQTVDGKRGRSGLVYAKSDPLLDKERPPCHWNCRSELLPLNRFNPVHRKLIEDDSIARRSNACHPLPKGWN